MKTRGFVETKAQLVKGKQQTITAKTDAAGMAIKVNSRETMKPQREKM